MTTIAEPLTVFIYAVFLVEVSLKRALVKSELEQGTSYFANLAHREIGFRSVEREGNR